MLLEEIVEAFNLNSVILHVKKLLIYRESKCLVEEYTTSKCLSCDCIQIFSAPAITVGYKRSRRHNAYPTKAAVVNLGSLDRF